MGRPRSTRQPVADRMYHALLQQFLSGERRASEPLNIDALARELEVSQTPVREALARLEHTGLVVREALRGYRVADALTDDDVAQLLAARLVIEPELTRSAAGRTSPEFLRALQLTVDDLADASSRADLDAAGFEHYWISDHEFHLRIAAQSDNRFLEHAFLSLEGAMQRFRLFTKRGRTGAAQAASDHQKIVDALAGSDSDGAVELMRAHLVAAKERVFEHSASESHGAPDPRSPHPDTSPRG